LLATGLAWICRGFVNAPIEFEFGPIAATPRGEIAVTEEMSTSADRKHIASTVPNGPKAIAEGMHRSDHELDLRETYIRCVLNDPDVHEAATKLSEALCYRDLTGKFVGVPEHHRELHIRCYERKPYPWIVEALESENGEIEHDPDTEVGQMCDVLNNLGKWAFGRMVMLFRTGELVATGVVDPPPHDLERTQVPADWWWRRDANFSFAGSFLAIGRKPTLKKVFTGIRVTENFIGNRLKPNTTLSEAFHSIAGHQDREALRLENSGEMSVLEIPAPYSEPLDNRCTGSDAEKYNYRVGLVAPILDKGQSFLETGVWKLRYREDLTAEPSWIPAERVPSLRFDFGHSTVRGPDFPLTQVRVFPGDQTAHVRSGASNVLPPSNPEGGPSNPPRKVGRPSREDEILSAWNQLKGDRLIDFKEPKIRAIELVHSAVLAVAESESVGGLSNETIRGHTSEDFDVEKAKKNRQKTTTEN
jgi:hypothetical protein